MWSHTQIYSCSSKFEASRAKIFLKIPTTKRNSELVDLSRESSRLTPRASSMSCQKIFKNFQKIALF